MLQLNHDAEYLHDFADMAGNLECIVIDQTTQVHELKNELRWNDVYYLIHNK